MRDQSISDCSAWSPDDVVPDPVGKTALRRVWQFAHPYRRAISGFLITILVTAVIALIPPFMFRMIVDHAIPDGDKRRIVTLTVVLVVVALGDAVLQIVHRSRHYLVG